MTPDQLEAALVLADTIAPFEAREAIRALVAEVRRLQGETADTERPPPPCDCKDGWLLAGYVASAKYYLACPHHPPADECPRPGPVEAPLVYDHIEDDDGDPEGCA